jgi:hypothetical protein
VSCDGSLYNKVVQEVEWVQEPSVTVVQEVEWVQEPSVTVVQEVEWVQEPSVTVVQEAEWVQNVQHPLYGRLGRPRV